MQDCRRLAHSVALPLDIDEEIKSKKGQPNNRNRGSSTAPTILQEFMTHIIVPISIQL